MREPILWEWSDRSFKADEQGTYEKINGQWISSALGIAVVSKLYEMQEEISTLKFHLSELKWLLRPDSDDGY